MSQHALQLPFSKRWNHKREQWVPRDAVIDPNSLSVDIIRDGVAKPFIQEHHYSGTFPASVCNVGLYLNNGVHPSCLIGVIVFAVPSNSATMRKYTGFDIDAACTIARVVLLPDALYNAESWTLTRATALLQQEKPHYRALLSFADPLERHNAAGELTKQMHYGQIYQASNARFCGRTRPRILHLTPHGLTVDDRTISKIRGADPRDHSAIENLLAAGAPCIKPKQTPRHWFSELVTSQWLRRVKHPGNFAYAFALDRYAKQQIDQLWGPQAPYPKKPCLQDIPHPLRTLPASLPSHYL